MKSLKDEIKQKKPFSSIQEECFLNLMRSMSVLEKPVLELMKARGTTPAQYNVLRILAGADKSGLTCGEIKERMLTRVPDLTRMIDRLLKDGLVDRTRSDNDRRVVRVVITSDGRKVATSLKPELAGLHKDMLSHMSDSELAELNALLTKIRNTE